jgi:hypothetical protein
MKTAYGTINGFEVMRMFRKGQFTPWIDAIGARLSIACSASMPENLTRNR